MQFMHETSDNGLNFFENFLSSFSFLIPFFSEKNEKYFFISHFREMNSCNRKKAFVNFDMTGERTLLGNLKR